MTDRINFNVYNIQLTKKDTTDLVIYHPLLETFPYNYDGWYNIGIDSINYFILCLIPHTVIFKQ